MPPTHQRLANSFTQYLLSLRLKPHFYFCPVSSVSSFSLDYTLSPSVLSRCFSKICNYRRIASLTLILYLFWFSICVPKTAWGTKTFFFVFHFLWKGSSASKWRLIVTVVQNVKKLKKLQPKSVSRLVKWLESEIDHTCLYGCAKGMKGLVCYLPFTLLGLPCITINTAIDQMLNDFCKLLKIAKIYDVLEIRRRLQCLNSLKIRGECDAAKLHPVFSQYISDLFQSRTLLCKIRTLQNSYTSSSRRLLRLVMLATVSMPCTP